MTPCIWLGTTHPCNPPNYLWSVGKSTFLHDVYCVFINIVFHPCYLFWLWNVVLKCLALCLITIVCCCLLSSPICSPHLLICTCLISSPIACPPSCVLMSIVFFLFLLYATFLCDSILACLWTYFPFYTLLFLSFMLTACQIKKNYSYRLVFIAQRKISVLVTPVMLPNLRN